MAYIECRSLSLSYSNTKVLSDLTFSVEKGDCLCIAGENGAGKSTLIKALLGLKAPTAGTITLSPELNTTDVGYLPQRSEGQSDFPASVWEVVLSGRLNRHGLFSFYNREDREDAARQLERLGIAHLKKRAFSELSGGQQQRVLLARALCAAKQLLLMDEPVSGLDPQATAEFYKLIGQLHSEGLTIVMVSHDLLSSLRCATRVLWLKNDGALLCTPTEFATAVPQLFTGGEDA